MKKTYFLFIIMFTMLFFNACYNSESASTPTYDSTYNSNSGIFYANGTPIVIDSDGTNTVVTWEGGNQIVPSTVTVIGGGSEQTSFVESDITMKNGTVSLIYGGGISLDSTKSANVDKANIEINGGNILKTVYGGGLIFANVNESRVTINGGKINSICGGGAASGNINGVSYAAGSQTDLENSKNRIEQVEVIINGGTIDSTPSGTGTVFGGGQGYSYVKNTKVTLNNGDLSKAYVTGGGSNGYTENTSVVINGGSVYLLQTVNRGILENVIIRINGGIIEKGYIGGETEDTSVTGKVSNVDFAILKGKINELNSGTNEGTELTIEQDKYKVATLPNTVINNNIPVDTQVTYSINLIERDVKLYGNESLKLNTKLVTYPIGHEEIFSNIKHTWKSTNENVAVVDENGIIKSKNPGSTTMIVEFLEDYDTVNVEVKQNINSYMVFMIIEMLILITFVGIATSIILTRS